MPFLGRNLNKVEIGNISITIISQSVSPPVHYLLVARYLLLAQLHTIEY